MSEKRLLGSECGVQLFESTLPGSGGIIDIGYAVVAPNGRTRNASDGLEADRWFDEEVRRVAGGLGTRISARFAGIGLEHPIEEIRGQMARPADLPK